MSLSPSFMHMYMSILVLGDLPYSGNVWQQKILVEFGKLSVIRHT